MSPPTRAESFNELYKAELIRQRGPWQGPADVEHVTFDYVDWFNARRLHGGLGMVPLAEFEAAHNEKAAPAARAASQ